MGTLDLKRFRQDLKETRPDRVPGVRGRPATTGAMAIVRKNLDLFDRLRSDDPTLTWGDIAVSLGKQGVIQGDGQPITAKRLSALISTIRKQRLAAEQAAVLRGDRSDVAKGRGGDTRRREANEARLTLAPDLVDPKHAEVAPLKSNTEEDHRRAALDRAKAILKKG